MIRKQFADPFCGSLRACLKGGDTHPFEVNDVGYLIRTAEGTPQVLVPYSLQTPALHLSHYEKLGDRDDGQKPYLTLRRDIYEPAIAVDCYATVKFCMEYAKNWVKFRKNMKKLPLFPARAKLKFVSIDILGRLITTRRG